MRARHPGKCAPRFLPLFFSLLLIFSSAASPVDAAEFDFHGIPLSAAVQAIARAGSFNVVLDHQVSDAPVTMSLRDVDPEIALDLLARAHGLTIHRFSGNTVALAPLESQDRYGNTETVILRLHEADSTAIIPALQTAFPTLRFAAAGPGRIAVAGILSDEKKQELTAFLGEVDRTPPSADIRLAVVSRDVRESGAVGLRLVDGDPGRRLVLDAEAVLSRESGRGSGQFVLGGRVSVGHTLQLFQGKQIPYRVGTAEVQTAEAGDGGSITLVSASPSAIVLDIDIERSRFLGSSVWQGTGGSRLVTRISLRPGETVAIGGLNDTQSGSGREDWLLRRWQSGETDSLITVVADLVP